MALDAGEVALEFEIDRAEQDNWGLRSQERWAKAYEEGKFKVGEEIMALEIPQRKGDPVVLDRDEPPRKTTLEKLGKLRTIYGSPTVTAGNAPGMNAGGSAIVIMSRKKADKLGLQPLATIETMAWDAAEPKYMATLPAKSINKALSNAQKRLEDLDLIEINEAFAAVTLVSLKALAEMDAKKYSDLQAITNINGGATMTLMYELMRRGGGCGAAAICGGLGQGESIILQV